METSGTELFFPSPAPEWSAHWIWPRFDEANGRAPAVTVCFRKEFWLDEAPSDAKAWISADWHYRLFVNGRFVSRGPTDAGQDFSCEKTRETNGETDLYFTDPRDAAAWFQAGRNVIAVEVFAERLTEWYGSRGFRGFFFQAEVLFATSESRWLRSDESWRTFDGDYYRMDEKRLGYFPVREPANWRLADFDDRSWALAVKVGLHWPKLHASEMPPPAEVPYPWSEFILTEGERLPDAEAAGFVFSGNARFSLQYDRVIAAHVRIRVRGPRGCRVHLDLSESAGPGRRAAFIELSGGEDVFETPFYSSLVFLHVSITGNDRNEAVVIHELGAVFRSYPVAYRGTFSSSDPALDQLWVTSRWACQICMQDHFLDSPDHQEPLSDPGDSLIESLISFRAFGDRWAARQELRKFAAILERNGYLCFHTSYSLLWLQMLVDYHDHTGDADLLIELAPTVHGLLDRFSSWRGANGLINEAPDYMFMDWVKIDGIECHHPPAVVGQGYLTAFFYRGLADGQRVARLTGNEPRRSAYEQLRVEIHAAFQRELWNPDRGRYRDGRPFQTSVAPSRWLPADVDIETHSPQVNTLAVLYDLAPMEQQAAILGSVLEASDFSMTCQPYFMHFVFEALAHAGLFEELAPAQLRRWKTNPVTGTFPEMWDGGDWSHGWCGTPLYQISSKILGVTPMEPGFHRVRIQPLLFGLSEVSGRVPTPLGEIGVAWSLNEAWIEIDIPSGVTADFYPPAAASPERLSAGRRRFPLAIN